MTVGMSSWDCLQTISDSNGGATSGAAATTSITASPFLNNANPTNATNATTTATTAANTATNVATNTKIENFEPVTSPSTSVSSSATSFSSSSTTSSNEQISLNPSNSKSNLNSNASTNTTTTTTTSTPTSHSLGSLKKARSGRNHAGAKYLASQYTYGAYIITIALLDFKCENR